MSRWVRLKMHKRRQLDPTSTDTGPFVAFKYDDGCTRIYRGGDYESNDAESIGIPRHELRRLAVQLMFIADYIDRQNPDDDFEDM